MKTFTLLLLVVISQPVSAAIVLLSGQQEVTFHSYDDTEAHVPTPLNFVQAMNGPQATLLPLPTVNDWHPLQSPYADAVPVFNMSPDGTGSSALFAVPFFAPVGTSSIEFVFTVDNNLGAENIPGLYLNGEALSDSSRWFPKSEFPDPSRFLEDQRIYRDDIAPLINQGGQNWLFMNVRDFTRQAGIMFGATVAVPEPASIAVWCMLGLFCGVSWKVSRRKT